MTPLKKDIWMLVAKDISDDVVIKVSFSGRKPAWDILRIEVFRSINNSVYRIVNDNILKPVNQF